MRRCVCSRNLKNEEAMTRVRPQRHRKKNVCVTLDILDLMMVWSEPKHVVGYSLK
jgi:hypothetical protein